MALMCPLMIAHWRHLANTTELVLPLAHPSPQPKRQIDQFSRFCTAHGRKSIYFTNGRPFLQNCHFSWGSGPPSNLLFLGPVRAHNPNGITIGSAVFCIDDRRVSINFTMSRPFPRPQNCPFHLDPHLIHGSLGLPESPTQTASRRFCRAH